MPRTWWSGIVILLFVPMLAWGQDAREWFEQGVEAFKAEEYREAARLFERAREVGLDSRSLHHNLGVVYYRLGQWGEARRSFRRLLDTRDAALAHYNLGLVASRRGREDRAQRHFRLARDGAESDTVRELATQALAEPRAPERKAYVYASVGLGYETNVILAAEDVADEQDSGDGFTEAMATAIWPVHEGSAGRFGVKGSTYVRDYWELDDFDLASVRAGPTWRKVIGAWLVKAEASGAQVFLDWDGFQGMGTVEVGVERALTQPLGIEVDYRGDWIDGQNEFGFL